MQTKLLKTLLIPTLGISTLGTIAMVSTSCGQDSDESNSPYMVVYANEETEISIETVGFIPPNLTYSFDAKNWELYEEEATIKVPAEQKVYIKGDNANVFSESTLDYSFFKISGKASTSGSIMGLLDNGKRTIEEIPCDFCFYSLFRDSSGILSVNKDFLKYAKILKPSCFEGLLAGCSSLIKGPELPAKTMAEDCYWGMFYNCTSLTVAPSLPATELADKCYYYMFCKCTSLTTAPKLPATKLVENCYSSMFTECTSLTVAPSLPAIKLVENCYWGMFYNCSSLENAPDLVSTELARNCYYSMFAGCKSLITAPDLPATNLVEGCYSLIFNDCTSLNSIKLGYQDSYSTNYFLDWACNVSSSGTLYYNGPSSAQDFGLNDWTKINY